MPTYTISAPAGRLTNAQKAQLAREVTRVHSEHTGAQTFFAQVVFVDVPASNWFVGGAPIDNEQIFINGQVRSGRSAQVKKALLEGLVEIVATVSAASKRKVWGYLEELPPAHMVEFGYVLPEPGREAEWLETMPAEDRAFLQSLGR